MIVRLFILILTGTTLACSADTKNEGAEAIRSIMNTQQNCWNQGDIDCFMKSYWQSDSLMFIGGNRVIYGYDNTLARYQKNYPDRAAMGQLTFRIIKL